MLYECVCDGCCCAGHSTVKRSHQDAEDDEDLTLPRLNSYKRIRTMPPDSPDSQATLPLSQPGSQNVTDSQHLNDSQRTNSYPLSQSEETSIEFLRGAFPSLPREVNTLFHLGSVMTVAFNGTFYD